MIQFILNVVFTCCVVAPQVHFGQKNGVNVEHAIIGST